MTLDAQQENEEGEAFCLGDTLASSVELLRLSAARSAECREHVEAALRTLPESFRTVVVLREIEGFGYEEIAEMLNVNLGTVKSRLTRGRMALREALRSSQAASAASAGAAGAQTPKLAGEVAR